MFHRPTVSLVEVAVQRLLEPAIAATFERIIGGSNYHTDPDFQRRGGRRPYEKTRDAGDDRRLGSEIIYNCKQNPSGHSPPPSPEVLSLFEDVSLPDFLAAESDPSPSEGLEPSLSLF